MKEIDYYLTSSSPFNYLGFKPIQDVATKHGYTLNIRPENIRGIWAETGAVPPAERPVIRQRMRLIELERFALHRGVPLNKEPKFFPVDPTLADQTIISLIEQGENPQPYMAGIFAYVWAHEKNIADEETLFNLLKEHNHNPETTLTLAKSTTITTIRDTNTQLAVKAGALGVPSYVLNGECFWGQDRISLLDEAITTERSFING